MMLRKRKARVLTRLKISEVSAVDKAAGEGCEIMLMKRASDAAFAKATRCLAESVKSIAEDSSCDKNEMLTKTFAQYQDYINTLMKSCPKTANLDVSVAPATDDEGRDNPDERDDEDDNGSTPHFHAGTPDDDDDEKEQTMKSHDELMSDVVKKYGIQRFCKSVENGDVRVSEHELTKLIDEQAKREGTTFSKLFEAQDEQGVTLRKAIAAARDAQFLSRTATMNKAQPQFSADRSSKPFHAAGAVDGPAGKPGVASLRPRVTGGRAAQAVDDPRSALDQLNELVAQQRAQHPELSEAGCFAMVYQDPKNADLAARERAENRPTAAWGG